MLIEEKLKLLTSKQKKGGLMDTVNLSSPMGEKRAVVNSFGLPCLSSVWLLLYCFFVDDLADFYESWLVDAVDLVEVV